MEMEQIDLTDPKKFFSELVKKALIGKQSDFEFIRSYEMLKVARLYRKGTKKVYKVFKSLHKALLKTYTNAIMTDDQKLDMIMSIKQFEVCYDYYKKEHAIAKDMLKEYQAYVFSGHILEQLFFYGVRPDEECVDYRKLPWKLF
jgi:hypothetical protein